MRFKIPGLIICVVVLSLALAGTATAQSSGGNLTGRVVYQDSGMPGVTVTVTSPALQGQKVTTTNAQGDYIFKSLPPGEYRVRFELADFTTLEYDVKMSTAQTRTLDAIMYPEAVEGEIVVTSSFETVSTGAQGSATIEQSLLEKLPVLRTLDSAVLLNAGTAGTGPYGNISISGAASWESLYTLNGMVLNENLRGSCVRPVHRGCASRDHHDDQQYVGRVRPLRGWRRQRGEQVGRERVLGLLPRQHEQ